MKKIIYFSIMFALILSACKKQSIDPLIHLPVPPAYLTSVEAYLKGHISPEDYRDIDFTKCLVSKQESNWYLRFGLKNKSLSADFLLLQTDSLGHPSDGRFIHIQQSGSDKRSYSGSIDISTLDRQTVTHSAITNGYVEAWHPKLFSKNTKSESFPVAYDELPEVVVVAYLPSRGSGISIGSFMMFQSIFADAGGGNNGYYGSSGVYSNIDYGGGGGGGFGGDWPNSDQNNAGNIDILLNFDNSAYRPSIDLDAWMKCFTAIPDDGATCTVTLLGDLPVDTDPGIGLNIWNGNTGHCFLQLTKTNGLQSVKQIIGFTTENPAQAILNTEAFVPGKTVDNAGHKYDCAITMNLTPYGLNTVIDKMKSLSSSRPYSVVHYDCLDYGLEVFNSVRPGNPLIVPKVHSFHDPFSNIATGPKLYNVLEDMVATGSPEAANISIGGPMHAGVSHGPCN